MNFNATLIGQSIAMLVFVWFCMKKIWPLILGAIEERQTEIADGLAAAEEGRASLSKAESEVAKIIGEARDQARGIIDQANARANEIVEAAKSEGETERQRQLEPRVTDPDRGVGDAAGGSSGDPSGHGGDGGEEAARGEGEA